MYSPTTRLLTVLELLQSHNQMSGSELARRLGVDTRTVRRYIVMLQDMGIPVEAERGPQGGYQLRRGYRLPPLMFTDAEAIALSLGLLVIREFRFPVDAAAVEGALAKTERVMPKKLLDQARGLQEAITFNFLLPPVQPKSDFVPLLSLAVRQRQRVQLHYQSWHGHESQREFDPYGIVVNEGYWYVAGYCHLRSDMRTFRLDRIIALKPAEGSFELPEDFDPLEHVLSSLAMMPGTMPVEVLIQTSLDRAQQAIPADLGTLEETKQGVLFRRAATQLEWIAHFLLTVDEPMIVQQPAELCDMMRKLAARALQMAGDGHN